MHRLSNVTPNNDLKANAETQKRKVFYFFEEAKVAGFLFSVSFAFSKFILCAFASLRLFSGFMRKILKINATFACIL